MSLTQYYKTLALDVSQRWNYGTDNALSMTLEYLDVFRKGVVDNERLVFALDHLPRLEQSVDSSKLSIRTTSVKESFYDDKDQSLMRSGRYLCKKSVLSPQGTVDVSWSLSQTTSTSKSEYLLFEQYECENVARQHLKCGQDDLDVEYPDIIAEHFCVQLSFDQYPGIHVDIVQIVDRKCYILLTCSTSKGSSPIQTVFDESPVHGKVAESMKHHHNRNPGWWNHWSKIKSAVPSLDSDLAPLADITDDSIISKLAILNAFDFKDNVLRFIPNDKYPYDIICPPGDWSDDLDLSVEMVDEKDTDLS